LEALNPGASDRLKFVDPEEAEWMGLSIMEECPEISVEVSVQAREDGPNQVINPEVGEISPIELYEASLSEARTRYEDGLPIRAIERHPDGHKEDADDGMDHMFGRRVPLDQRTYVRKELIEPSRFFPILPAPDREPNSEQVQVDCGVRGNWITLRVPKTIGEDEFQTKRPTQHCLKNQRSTSTLTAASAKPLFPRGPTKRLKPSKHKNSSKKPFSVAQSSTPEIIGKSHSRVHVSSQSRSFTEENPRRVGAITPPTRAFKRKQTEFSVGSSILNERLNNQAWFSKQMSRNLPSAHPRQNLRRHAVWVKPRSPHFLD
jgi:hypothetical protein